MSKTNSDSIGSQIDMLIETVEMIRAEKYPDLPENLVKSILLKHEDIAASETDLIRDMESLVEALVVGDN